MIHGGRDGMIYGGRRGGREGVVGFLGIPVVRAGVVGALTELEGEDFVHFWLEEGRELKLHVEEREGGCDSRGLAS